MSLYLDSSAFLAVLLSEPAGERVREAMLNDADWFSARHTLVEVRRNLARRMPGDGLESAMEVFRQDWSRTNIIELDEATCDAAAGIGAQTLARSLDALHLAAAQRVSGPGLTVLTLDRRQAAVARMVGLALADAAV